MTAREPLIVTPPTLLSRMQPVAHPFIKSVGGKTQLLPELLARVPTKFGDYYEPFIGGGAMFFALYARGLLKQNVILNDANERLIAAYICLRDKPNLVIGELASWELLYRAAGEDFYYSARDRFNSGDSSLSPFGGAAHFIGLNKTCFNGLYRVNRKGDFNVPAGKYKNPTICDAENLMACSGALEGATITAFDFEKASAKVKPGDFWYADCPYIPVSKTSDFTSYTADGFTIHDQTRLRDFALKLKAKGVHVMLSNSIAAESLYRRREFKVEVVEARRAVNSKASKRGAVKEIIVT